MNMRKKLWTLLFLNLFLFACRACADDVSVTDLRDSQQAYGEYVASLNRISISNSGAKTDRGKEKILVLLKTDGLIPELTWAGLERCVNGPQNRFTLVFSSAEVAGKAVSEMRKDPHILYAEPDHEVDACDTASLDDMTFWSYGADYAGFSYLNSWCRHYTNHCSVAVIDSGVFPHAMLSSRLINGWDYVDNDEDPTNDGYGHGTHVAGIVADCTQGNEVSVYSIRVLNEQGKGKISNTVNGILEAAEKGIPIINLSFVSTTASEALDDAVLTAAASGCTVVVSAGNNNTDTADVYPAHLMDSGVIVVGAADKNGNRASFSNYGESVDCYMYGSGINSCSNTGSYTVKSGTSQAAPHISAACALLSIIYGNPSSDVLEAKLKAVLGGVMGTIPMVDRLVPQRINCHLTSFRLGKGETLTLPTRALPLMCNEQIRWSVSDETVMTVEDGILSAVNSGTALLTGMCSNFDVITATVQITEEASKTLQLPAGLRELSDEAFADAHADYLIAGSLLTTIGSSVTGPDTVILCPSDSHMAEHAEKNGYQYVAYE